MYMQKQIIAIFWIMWTSSQLQYAWRGVHCRSPVVTVVSCEEHRALKTIHWSSAHSTCSTCVIQPHSVRCVTQTPICSLKPQIRNSICCDGLNSFIGSPCHLVFSEYIPVHVLCRLYICTTGRDNVTQATNTHSE